MDIQRLIEMLEEELNSIADKGITSGNMERTYKLIDMYKDLKTVEMADGGHSERRYANNYDRDSSYAQKRSRTTGRYMRDDGMMHSNAYDEYMDSKQRYRTNHSASCKQEVMDTLDAYMDDFTRRMEELAQDADCREERETIEKYIWKIKQIK